MSLSNRARGLVVMIVACQVIDPGSIPGERIFLLLVPFCVPFSHPRVIGLVV